MMEKTESASILVKIEQLDRRYIYTGLVIVIIFPFLFPGVYKPNLQITEGAHNYADVTAQIKPTDKVLYKCGISATFYAEQMPQERVAVQELFSKKPDIIFITETIESARYFLNDVIPTIPASVMAEMPYGEKWMLSAMLPGGESGSAAFVADIRSIMQYDYYGTPIDELPVMDGIETYRDFDYCYGARTDRMIGQYWSFAPEIPILVSTMGQDQGLLAPFMATGQVDGAVFGIQGAMELEILFNRPGPATARTVSLTLAMNYTLFIVLFANIVTFLRKTTVGELK